MIYKTLLGEDIDMNVEIWKPHIRQTRNGVKPRTILEISNFGNVRGPLYNFKPFSQDCIGLDSGKRVIGCYRKNRIYVLVWTLFNGPIPKGYCIHHIDLNPLNDRLDNLQLMTRSEHCRLHQLLRMQDEEFRKNVLSNLIHGQRFK